MRYFNPRLAGAIEPGSMTFAVGVFAICLFLQRFGATFGGQSLNVVGPIGLAMAIVGLVNRQLTFDVARLKVFLAMLAAILGGAAFNGAMPVPFVGPGSTGSMVQFVALTSFTVLGLAKPVNEAVFFRTAQRFFIVIGVAGIVQFFAQMAGLRVFSFSGLVPAPMLVETGWNLEIPSGVGDLLKSNGFFLVEPSVMSQFMAVAVAIELLYFRRPLYLGVFAAGLLLSFSGTGVLVLFAFALSAALRLGWRGVALVLLLAALLATAAGLTMVLSPDVAAAMQNRLGEISTPGTSGHLRFTTPFWLLGDILRRFPVAALVGIGAGTSEHLTMPYEYDVNTPVKISLEFGFPVFVLYVTLFLTSKRTARQSVLVLPGLVLLMLTGAYQQFAPVVFLIALLLCTARLEPAMDGAD